MRFVCALLVSMFGWLGDINAETFRVSTAEAPETEVMMRLMTEVYRKLGHELKLVIRPAKRSLSEVNKGVSDAELARITGAENKYPNLVRVAEPVFALSISAVVRKDSKLWMSSWEDIGKHRVAYPRGYQILDIRTRDMNAMEARNAASVVRMVKAGRVDAGLVITSDAERLASEIGDVSVLTPPVETVTLYHYVNVKHRRLVPAMEKVLIELNDSGRAKELLRPEH